MLKYQEDINLEMETDRILELSSISILLSYCKEKCLQENVNSCDVRKEMKKFEAFSIAPKDSDLFLE